MKELGQIEIAVGRNPAVRGQMYIFESDLAEDFAEQEALSYSAKDEIRIPAARRVDEIRRAMIAELGGNLDDFDWWDFRWIIGRVMVAVLEH